MGVPGSGVVGGIRSGHFWVHLGHRTWLPFEIFALAPSLVQLVLKVARGVSLVPASWAGSGTGIFGLPSGIEPGYLLKFLL